MATSTVMSLGELIDLAIGTPEVGVVDFCMVHTVLHCLAQQLRVTSKPVELRGHAMALPARDREETVAVNEYVMDQADTSDDDDGDASEPDTPRKKTKQKTLLVVEKVKKTQPSATPSAQEASQDQPTPEGSIIQKPQVVLSTEKLASFVTISRFNLLDATVRDLVDKVCGDASPRERGRDLSPDLEEGKDPSEMKPKSSRSLKEGSTSVNIFSRLEAAEEEIMKLNTIVQDLITENPELKTTSKIDATQSSHSSRRDSPRRSPARDPTQQTLKSSTKSDQGLHQETEDWTDKKKLSNLKHTLDKIREELENVTNSFYTIVANMDVEFDSSRSGSIHPSTEESAMAESLIEGQLSEVQKSDTHRRFISSTRMMERLDELEKRWQDSLDTSCDEKIKVLQQQLDRLSMQVSMFADAGCIPTPNIPKDLEGLLSLFETVQQMQEELRKVHETAIQLAAEKDTRQLRFDALIEQVEYLKNIKLDRVVMEEAMAEKADLRMLARKVSYNQFELACDDLSKGLEHTLGKLDVQETLWQQALDDIQREIEMKLDKMEFSPMKEAFNNKLRKIQENLKKLSKFRETEAAGTKRRLLKDVNCISCDAKAVMPAEAESAVPVACPLPPSLSIKPYLTYELDAIRKAQATSTPQRNMRDWELIEKQMPTKYTKLSKSGKDKHLCNRYCGGSHTVVSPAQRVARTGHFIKQWGPDVIPLGSGLEPGEDGRLYKVSTAQGPTPASTDIDKCTPKPKAENEKTQNFTSECHCLEEEP
ncbi:uncharacterized protein LOC121729287 [Aricia agestis]|uniref:uncharacterized protein LOC121729287 n=1 Tax=Aricia agestis TaxID=91739 RepID=UPI001C207BBE|nr:uncharacterized protein LOC121729287 [Aricia agestis]